MKKADLDQICLNGCDVPGCDHTDHDGTLFFRGRCHPTGKIDVSYTYGTGKVKVACRECGQNIGIIEVAE